jgi:hypothetical protein
MTTQHNRLRAALETEDQRNRDALRHRMTWYAACRDESSPCKAGRMPCPSPEACRRTEADALDEVAASVRAYFVVAAAMVIAAYLWAGGAADLVMWIRGLL